MGQASSLPFCQQASSLPFCQQAGSLPHVVMMTDRSPTSKHFHSRSSDRLKGPLDGGIMSRGEDIGLPDGRF